MQQLNLRQKADKVRMVRKALTAFFNQMVEVYGGDAIIEEVMLLRQYHSEEMRTMLKRVGVYKAGSYTEFRLINNKYTDEILQDFGLVTEAGDYHMGGRYVLPIRDITGDVMALVGWDSKGGARKYLTTPTYGYNRDIAFFNYDIATREAWQYRGGQVIEVEGIFDALALTSVRFPALANTGLEMSHVKEIMLGRFNKTITLTDNDRGGRTANPYLYSSQVGISDYAERNKAKKIWIPDSPNKLHVALAEGVKDPDEYVRDYQMEEELEVIYELTGFLQLTL